MEDMSVEVLPMLDAADDAPPKLPPAKGLLALLLLSVEVLPMLDAADGAPPDAAPALVAAEKMLSVPG